MSSSEGLYSAKLVTKSCPNCPNFNLPDPATGFMDQVEDFSGTVMDSVKFDYKYIPAAVTDTGYFQMSLTHWVNEGDSSSIDYYANYHINQSADWVTASSPLLVNSNLGIPDTLDLAFFTSLGAIDGVGTDTDGSELYIDNIRFVSTITGVEESLQDVLNIKVYPNPVVEYLIFESDTEEVQRVDFFDTSGKIVQSELLFAGKTRVELSNQSLGTYFYIVYAKEGRQMKSGKFIVADK